MESGDGIRMVVLDGATLNPGDNPWTPLEALGTLEVHAVTEPDAVIARASGAQVVLTNKTRLSAETLAELAERGLGLVSVTATGVDVVDIEAARALGVPVTHVPEYGTREVAQHVLALMMALNHQVVRHDAAVRAGEWVERDAFAFWLEAPVSWVGATMGVVGFGRIGRAVARLARALGMEVIAHTRTRQALEACDPPARWVELDALFAEADVISLHCPLTDATRGLVSAARLARVKPSALLINTARGGLVDEDALADALEQGRLRGAGLDVVSREPLEPSARLLSAPRCLVTPHMAWAPLSARRRLTQTVAESVRAFVERGEVLHAVNGPWPADGA